MSKKKASTRVFLYTGRIAHLVDFNGPPDPDLPSERKPSLCNFRPVWPGVWYGLNGDADKANSLPICRTCEAMEEKRVGA